jgi:cytoskeletal protein CcmA (bactofilin family)
MSSKNFYGLTGDVTVDGGILNVGNAQLYANTETSNVGIGTTNAEFKLDVHGDANVENLYATYLHGDGSNIENIVSSQWEGSPGDPIYYTSNVGIANTSPVTKTLQVGSNLYVEDAGSNVIHVTGNVYADYFVGDGSQLTGIAASLDQIVDQGNTVSNTIQLVSGQDATSNVGLVTHEGVSISVSNANPTGEYQFGVGSNLLVNVYSSNVLTVGGNVFAQKMTLGSVTVTPAYNLQQITETGPTTNQTLVLSNVTTGLTADANVVVNGNVTAGSVITSGNVNAGNVITSSNIEVGGDLSVTGNVYVNDMRVAEVASNLMTYDSTTGELLDSGGLFSNKLAVVSEQPPIALTGASTAVTSHGTYTIEASSGTVVNLFDKNPDTKWVTGNATYSDVNGEEGTHIGSARLYSDGPRGEWAKITMPYKTILRHVKIESTNISIKDVTLVGLNADGLTWTSLKTVDGLNEETSTIIVNAATHHRTYGLIVRATNIGATQAEIGDLKLFTESFSIDGGKVAMASSAVMGGETTVEQSGPHGRGTAVLKKFPEIAFESGKFDKNDSTNTYVQAGYTVTASSVHSDPYQPWKAFDDNISNNTGWLPNFTITNHNYSGSDFSYSPTGTSSLTTNTSDVINGEWLQIKLPSKIQLNSIVLHARSANYTQIPEDFKVLGSNTGIDGSWVVLASFVDESGAVNSGTEYDINALSYYNHYALITTQVVGDGGTNYGLSIAEWKLYGYEELATQGDTSVDTTFTSIMNTPQTTGANVYVDGNLGETFTNRVTGPDATGTATTYDSTGKYWELTGALTSNVSLEANTFLEGDQPHAVSVWFNSSNLEANVSNTCVFSISDQEKLDSVNLDLQSNTWHNLTYAYQGEGGSRVTYLDGRKVAEDQAEDTFGEYPPFAMTGYSQGGYVVSASSELGSAYLAHEAFNGTFADNGDAWLSVQQASGAHNYSGGSGAYVGTANLGSDSGGTAFAAADKGEWLKLEMPYKFVLDYITICGSTDLTVNPKNWKIYGSNDDKNWDVLLSKTNTVTVAYNATSGKEHTVGATKAYKYFALVVTATNGFIYYTQVSELEFYGHRENDLVRLPDPTNVLKYPHIAMTGPAQRGYVASASTNHSNGNHPTRKVFDGDITNDWQTDSGRYSDSGGGVYTHNAGETTVTNVQSRVGDWVQLESPHKIRVKTMKFTPVATYGQERSPGTGVLVGSNDNGDTWTEIKSFDVTVDGTPNSYTAGSPTTLAIDSGSNSTPGYYKIHRLIWLTLYTASQTTYANRASVADLEFFGTGVDSIPIQIGGGNIDKVANFRVYDKFVGEDQALEIWDAQKDAFGRAKSSMTLHKGRLGIGTTEPEGRLAVADEPDADAYGLQEFPPKPLAANNTHIEGHGVFRASASSVHNSSYLVQSFRAFDHNIGSYHEPYYSDNPYGDQTGDGSYVGGDYTTNGYAGEWLQLQLPYKVKLSKFSLTPRIDWGGRAPKQGVILALNYTGNEWVVVHTHDDTGGVYGNGSGFNAGGVETRTFKVNGSNDGYYDTFRFVTTHIWTPTGSSGTPNIAEWRLFGTREQGQSVLHDGQLTLTKNLTVPSIGPSVTNTRHAVPKRHKLLVEFDTSTNPTDLTTVRDTSGMGNDGTLIGDAYYSIVDKALVFDGSGDYIQMKDWTYGTGFVHSFSGWVKFKSPEESWQVLYGVGDASGTGRTNFTIWPLTQSNYFRTEADGGGGSIDHTFEFTGNMDKWLHVAVVKSGAAINTTRMYINGEILPQSGGSNASSDIALPNTPQNFNLGSYGPSSASHINADFSNVKFYNAALTAGDVKTLYDMGRGDSYHVTNFQNTLVGINLGNGQAPRSALDVRDKIYAESSTVQTFTGQHICFPDESMEKGLIVSAKKNKFVKLNGLATGKSAITIDESLPIVSLSNVSQDKACFGVVSKMEESNAAYRTEITGGLVSESVKIVGDNRAIVNSVGEGAIWVVDTNGPLESGDYITTSNVAGYGQKQDSEFLANYSVAKITMDCDFTGSNVAVQTIKREETGTRIITEDAWNQLVEYDRSSNTETQYSNTLVSSDYSGQSGYTPREVTTIMDYTDGSNLISTAEWSNLESNIQNTYQSNTFTEIVDYTKFVSFSEWSNLTTDVQNTYSEAEITTYYQIQRGENVLDENGQLQFEDKTGATEAPYERRFLDASGAQTDSANAVHIAAFVGCTYHCG